jgi:hypothetical protein
MSQLRTNKPCFKSYRRDRKDSSQRNLGSSSLHRRNRSGQAGLAGFATSAALCTVVCIATPAVATPFTNGDFEMPGNIPSFVTVPDTTHPSNFITGWTVTDGNVDYGQGPGGTVCQTTGHCVDLNGSKPGKIEQIFDTKQGDVCKVSFWMARHGSLPSSPATMAVLINNVPVTGSPYTHSDPSGTAVPPAQWQQHGFTFTAATNSTTLAFQSTTTAPNPAAGPQIDNVTINCAPPPQQGRLKVCKVAGPFVPLGTPYTFQAGTSSPFTVRAGPAPGGTCSLGPTFNVGSMVSVTETIPSGTIVSAITVAPPPRLVGVPNLAGGSVQVAIGSGVTEVTFTDRKQTGFLEICKAFTPANLGGGSHTFTVNPGNLGPFVVPARGCSPAIEVAAGTVVITEVLPPGNQLAGCSTIPATQQGACNLAAGTSTVNVGPGDVSTQTIAIFTNKVVWHDIELDEERH